jgi:hypothetical protein
MIHIYHPNKRVTGFATSFWYSDRDDTIFATLLKQSGWDDARQNGVFKDSMNDPNRKVNIKLSYTEVAAILDCIERNRPFSTFHDADEFPKQIKFEPWLDQTTQKPKGYSFSISVQSKQDSSYKNAFYIGLTFAEARLIREFLIFTMHRHFTRLSTGTQRAPVPRTVVQDAPAAVEQEAVRVSQPDDEPEEQPQVYSDPLTDF